MATAPARLSQSVPVPTPRRYPKMETAYYPDTRTIPDESLARITNNVSTDLIASLEQVAWQSEEILRTPLSQQQQLGISCMTATLDRMLSVARKLQQCSQVLLTSQWDTVDCHAVMLRVCEGLRDVLRDTGSRVIWNELPRIHAMGPVLSMVFQELITNAVNYRSADVPVIQVEARRNAEGWLFSFEDNGIGFDQRHRSSMFDAYYTIDPRSSRAGLGLTVARAAVTHLGGRIWAESNRRGGSTFSFTVPTSLIGGV